MIPGVAGLPLLADRSQLRSRSETQAAANEASPLGVRQNIMPTIVLRAAIGTTLRPLIAFAALGLPLYCAADHPANLVLTGEVRSRNSQELVVPPSVMSPVTIKYFVADGQPIKAGDVVLKIDPGVSAAQIPRLEAELAHLRIAGERDMAELRVKAIDAELTLIKSEANLANARIDARIPRGIISELSYDQYQGELKRAIREAELDRANVRQALTSLVRKQKLIDLAIKKLELEIAYYKNSIEESVVLAERTGHVIHGFNRLGSVSRIDEGSSVLPGSSAGQIVVDGGDFVRAFVLDSDRGRVTIGQNAQISFDAIPKSLVHGKVHSISGAAERKPEWGRGHYFNVDLMIETPKYNLKPGMSARVILLRGDQLAEKK